MSTRTRITYLMIAAVMLVGVVFPMGVALAQDFPEGTPRIFLPVISNRANPNSGLNQTALNLVAARYGVPVSDLVVDASSQAEYQYLGKTTTTFKISNAANGEAYGIELDDAGVEVDSAALLAADAQAYTDQYGKIEPALAEVLAVAGDASVPVIIALNGAEDISMARVDLDVEMTAEQMDAFRAEAIASQEAAIEVITAPFVAALDSMGIKVTAASQLAYAYGTMQANQVEAVAQMPEVRVIGLDIQNESDLNFIWPYLHYQTVYNRRINGAGTKLAINEVGHGINTSNPYLRLLYSDTYARCGSASSHEVGVAGIISSSNVSYTGLAMAAQLGAFGSCGGYGGELQTAANRAVSWGADAINMSWGATYPSRLISRTNEGFYDDLWRNTWTAVVKSSGNNGTRAAPYTGLISNPAGAYNILTVGAETRSTSPTIASFSSWVNPDTLHDDIEKPEVTATGVAINSTKTASPWVGAIGDGTSFSTPVVTALMGDIIQRNYSLASWPEALKAIAMASATRNIYSGTSRDGAGGIDFTNADNIMAYGYGGYGGMNYYCSTATPYTRTTMSIPYGKRVRYVISWDTYSAYANYTTRPSADLELKVYRNDTGALVAQSISYDRTNEWVEFTAPASTTYSFKIVRYNCYGNPNYLGWAYYRWP